MNEDWPPACELAPWTSRGASSRAAHGSTLSEKEGGEEYGETKACSELGKRHSESQTLKKKYSF